METTAFLSGIAFTLVCAFVGALFRADTRNSKYCPTCGRMLPVYEHEEWKTKI
jgi:hypothetical protein